MQGEYVGQGEVPGDLRALFLYLLVKLGRESEKSWNKEDVSRCQLGRRLPKLSTKRPDSAPRWKCQNLDTADKSMLKTMD